MNDDVVFPLLSIAIGAFIGSISLFAPSQDAMLAGLGFGSNFVTGGFTAFQQTVKKYKQEEDEEEEDV